MTGNRGILGASQWALERDPSTWNCAVTRGPSVFKFTQPKDVSIYKSANANAPRGFDLTVLISLQVFWRKECSFKYFEKGIWIARQNKTRNLALMYTAPMSDGKPELTEIFTDCGVKLVNRFGKCQSSAAFRRWSALLMVKRCTKWKNRVPDQVQAPRVLESAREAIRKLTLYAFGHACALF